MEYEKIWNKTLGGDEKVEFEFSIGKKYRIMGLILWGFISLMFSSKIAITAVIFLIALFYYGYYLKAANAFALTNKRVIAHKGWLNTYTNSVEYSKITDVHVKEPFFDKVLTQTGNIGVETAGFGSLLILRHVDAPYEIKKKLDTLKDAARKA